jgi:hypothetical protein
MTEQHATTRITDKDLSEIDLIKWPGCDVDGDSVTPEQAMEILVRTQPTYFDVNDKKFGEIVEGIFYSTIPKPEWGEKWWQYDYDYQSMITLEEDQKRRENLVERHKQKDTYHKEMGTIDLQYLSNSRVCSSYIGGPYGWCDWSGKIFQRGKNIGKWPSTTKVYDEWKLIAEAFPFLRLTCRLLSHEAGHSEGNPGIAIVYEVENGEVWARTPAEGEVSMITGEGLDLSIESFLLNFNNPNKEKGVTPERWEKACQLTAQKQKQK